MKHKNSPQIDGGIISVKVTEMDDGFQFTVYDSGYGDQNTVKGTGTGLKNTKERLIRMYGKKSNFKTDFNPDGSTVSFWISHDTVTIEKNTINDAV